MGNMRDGELTYKQKRFVEEVIADSTSMTAAAKRAGYSIKTAGVQAYELLQKPKIAEKIQEANEEAAKRLGITKERILQELAQIAFANLKHVISFDESGNTTVDLPMLKDEVASAVTELTISSVGNRKDVKVKLSDKQAALIAIARMLGWDKEKVEVTGKVSLEQLIEQSFSPEEPVNGE